MMFMAGGTLADVSQTEHLSLVIYLLVLARIWGNGGDQLETPEGVGELFSYGIGNRNLMSPKPGYVLVMGSWEFPLPKMSSNKL